MKTRIAPSLLAADYSRLGQELEAVEQAGADWLHLDVMDGHFVPNISYGAGLIGALRPLTQLPFDVHLMIAPYAPYLADFAKAGAQTLTIHAEADAHVHRGLQAIKDLGCRAGLALNPGTPLSLIEPLLPDLDLLLLMTVNPGFGGQSFITTMLPKIEAARALIDASGRAIDLEVDGGVNPQTAGLCKAAGADVLVAGSAVFGQGDYAAAIAALRGA